MRVIGVATCAIDALSLPGDFPARLDPERLKGLSESIQRDGLIHPPLVRQSDKLVVCGGDRIAALKLAGQTLVEVRLCEASDTEVVRLRAAENVFRRADLEKRDEYLREYVAALEEEEVTTNGVSGQGVPKTEGKGKEEAPPKKRRGRPPSTKKKAREKAAADLGVSERTIRRAEEEPHEASDAPAPVIEMHGLQMPLELGLTLREVADAMDKLDNLFRLAQGVVTRLGRDIAGSAALRRVDLQRLHNDLHAMATGVRAIRPREACAYCKLHPKALPNCAGCKGSGYLLEPELAWVPEELKATGDAAGIYLRGKFERLADL